MPYKDIQADKSLFSLPYGVIRLTSLFLLNLSHEELGRKFASTRGFMHLQIFLPESKADLNFCGTEDFGYESWKSACSSVWRNWFW